MNVERGNSASIKERNIMTKMKKKQEILGEERRVVRETLSKRPEGMLAWLDRHSGRDVQAALWKHRECSKPDK